MSLAAKQAQNQIFEGKCQDLTHCLLFSETGLLLSPALYLCLAEDEVEEKAYDINSSCQKEDISPAKLWILEARKLLVSNGGLLLVPWFRKAGVLCLGALSLSSTQPP